MNFTSELSVIEVTSKVAIQGEKHGKEIKSIQFYSKRRNESELLSELLTIYDSVKVFVILSDYKALTYH